MPDSLRPDWLLGAIATLVEEGKMGPNPKHGEYIMECVNNIKESPDENWELIIMDRKND